MKLFIMQFSLFPCHLFDPNILLSTLFSNTLSLCSSLNIRDQVSHAYRTSGGLFGPKRNEGAMGTGGCKKLHNKNLYNLYFSPNIIRIIESMRI
jgi:hypothetical protein